MFTDVNCTLGRRKVAPVTRAHIFFRHLSHRLIALLTGSDSKILSLHTIDLFADTAAILISIVSKDIMGAQGAN